MKEQKLPSATHFSKALIPPTSLKLLLLMLLMGSTLLNAVAYFSVFSLHILSSITDATVLSSSILLPLGLHSSAPPRGFPVSPHVESGALPSWGSMEGSIEHAIPMGSSPVPLEGLLSPRASYPHLQA